MLGQLKFLKLEFSYEFSCCSNPLPILYVPHFPKNSILIPIWKLNETQQILRVKQTPTHSFYFLSLTIAKYLKEDWILQTHHDLCVMRVDWSFGNHWSHHITSKETWSLQLEPNCEFEARVEKFTKSVASKSLEGLRTYILLDLKGFVCIMYCNYLL